MTFSLGFSIVLCCFAVMGVVFGAILILFMAFEFAFSFEEAVKPRIRTDLEIDGRLLLDVDSFDMTSDHVECCCRGCTYDVPYKSIVIRYYRIGWFGRVKGEVQSK